MCNVSLNGTQPSDASLRVLRALEAAGLEAWYVGGWVRDALMGCPSHDVDMCCSGLWQESKAALEAAGMLRMAARSAASGMARYPLATVAGRALENMGGLTETLEEAFGSTVVVEYESGGDGGAFEVGTAPAGSAELERLIAAARSEADELARIGGWAAVRIGFGGVETIDCETGRTVYAAGAE